MKQRKLPLALSLCAASLTSPFSAAEDSADGFLEGSRLDILNRNFYYNRDDRHGQSSPKGNGYSEAWAQGLIGRYQSGFTEGSVGFGIDAFVLLGLQLDSGDGRNGGSGSFNVLPVDNQGRTESQYAKAGGAAKVRLFDSVLKVGDVFPETPVVHYGDSRLLPESFRGVTLENQSVAGLKLQGGRLHSMSQPSDRKLRDGFATFYGGPVDSPWIAYLGGDYALTERISVSLYGSRLKDAWNQYYAGTTLEYPLADELALFGGFNYYKSVDDGRQLLGEFDTHIWSGKLGVRFGAHSVALTHQRNNGNNDFDYLRQADSIYLDNSIQYTDFNSPKERSWMLRYDIDMQTFGIPGLSFMTRYGKGTDADYSHANAIYMRRDENGQPLTGQKRWERDIEAKYVVQGGSLKDLSLRIRQATTRASQFESDLDEIRLIVEYPLQVL
ncbi:OprD family porin [Pseudomonas panipatensis]|uniref:Outer membrane porin, OprD family n=1 Tax=Pseudomonas panipatensis TaxID=428992 RepID=A0A1G8IZJ0_9PSED|nr:OprD family porin [Pseudomonas panipatensis]SDI24384.1 outer membrane porin, OprD family [Pseudomonas panipatensis]SMP48839.1 outer membrane porin, OprD family [Pseudomonas panipatensis]